MRRARGVDVSEVQAIVDWPAVRDGGFDYMIARGTMGATYVDKTCAVRVRAARIASMLVAGVYHVLTTQSAVADQASNALQAWQDHGAPIALDFELPQPPWKPPVTGDWLTGRALEFCHRVTDAGAKVLVYTYPWYANNLPRTPALDQLAAFPLWWAEYQDETVEPLETKQPKLIRPPWSAWTFWQWSGDHGRPAPGIPQVVDHDLFNGTPEELATWLEGPSVDQAQESAPDTDPSGPAA